MKTLLNKFSLIALLALALPALSHAATKKTEAEAPKTEEKANKPYPYHGHVVSISAKELVVKMGEKTEDHHFTITKDTKYVNHPHGEKASDASASDVKVGMYVGGQVRKVEKGDPEVVSINVGLKEGDKKAEAPATTPAKKKKTAS